MLIELGAGGEILPEIEQKIKRLSNFFDLTCLSILTNNLSKTNWTVWMQAIAFGGSDYVSDLNG